jgi:hypothetical protein
MGEALLTHDGDINHADEAKIVALNELADGMRSSTPELVLAALGLRVGTDMGHHLGDGSYVLVPLDEQRPWEGADVLHVGELASTNPRHRPSNVIHMDDPRAEALVRRIAVNELMGSWEHGPNNNVRSLALQKAAIEEFGLTDVQEWPTDPATTGKVAIELGYNGQALRDFLRTQHTRTQEALARRGLTEIVAYHVLVWPAEATEQEWSGLRAGDSYAPDQRPLDTWFLDRRIAADWLKDNGGQGAILISRKNAQEFLSLPTTGLGNFAHMEMVALPGTTAVTVDGLFSGLPRTAATRHPVAADRDLPGAARDSGPETHTMNAAGGTPSPPATGDQWQPITITAELDPADPLDSQIISVLDGRDEPPAWWPRDDSGYAITKRDLDFLGIQPVQLRWLLTGEAPMGMTPALYKQFGTELLDALKRDGIEPSEVDIRLKGTGAVFFSGLHKTLPRESDLIGNPQASQMLQQWFGDSEERPLRRPYNSMYRLGLENEPSDVDLDINSTAAIRKARDHWRNDQTGRYSGDFMMGHGYLDKQVVKGALPTLAGWAKKWEGTLGRPVSLGVFESSGPFDEAQLGRSLSSHFRETDWIIHNRRSPMALNTSQRKVSELPAKSFGAARVFSAAFPPAPDRPSLPASPTRPVSRPPNKDPGRGR